MANRCRGCKREIARGQQTCYFCGSPQSYTRYYLKSGVILVSLLAGLVWGGHWYIDKSVKEAEVKKAQFTEAKTGEALKKIEQAELQLTQANERIKQAETKVAEAAEKAAQVKLKLDETEKKAKKAEERASWLSKENRRFKAKIKELEDKVSTTKKASTINNNAQQVSRTTQINTFKRELANYESQKETLLNTISVKRTQLEESWRQISGEETTSVETIAQRKLQVEQATKEEQSRILLLNNQIEATKKKILDVETTKN